MIKIGLMGFEFDSPNKGCEALTYSFLNILKDIFNENVIIYNFSGTGLGKIPEVFKKFKFIDVKPKLKDITFKYMRSIASCNIIFDVTMGDSFSDIYSEKRFFALSRHKKIAEFLCRNYVLLPQTYGPFNNEKTLKEAKRILEKANKIYCRDQLSKELLEKEFKINDSELVSDMAFILPYNKCLYDFSDNKEVKRIGINVSGLLYKGGFDSNNQFDLKLDYKEYIESIIHSFISKNYEIHLIPHVIDISKDSHDDDYKVCQEIASKYEKCKLAPAFNTPIEAKSYISNMDYFIGSRMHSTIAAFSTGVITIPVSYSRKFEGLFNSLNYKYVINAKKDQLNSAIEKTIHFVEESIELEREQKKSLKIIEDKNNKFLANINEYIDGIGVKNVI